MSSPATDAPRPARSGRSRQIVSGRSASSRARLGRMPARRPSRRLRAGPHRRGGHEWQQVVGPRLRNCRRIAANRVLPTVTRRSSTPLMRATRRGRSSCRRRHIAVGCLDHAILAGRSGEDPEPLRGRDPVSEEPVTSTQAGSPRWSSTIRIFATMSGKPHQKPSPRNTATSTRERGPKRPSSAQVEHGTPCGGRRELGGGSCSTAGAAQPKPMPRLVVASSSSAY